MNHFKMLSNRSYAARINGLIKSGEKAVHEFYNVVGFNAVIRTMTHKDTTHVNKGIEAARAQGRLRSYLRIIRPIVPFKFEGGIFTGKIQKGKLGVMSERVKLDGKEVERWVAMLHENIDKEQEFDATAKATTWTWDDKGKAAVLRLVKKATSEGVTVEDFVKEVEKDYAEVAA